ncbi:hypothetical protein Ahy_B08g089422 [Arachis hypogaea]|uniref:RNase H type-1 domain-containing protein n=1 Tax=Arachis hypogaea TaxID=3818 RepID=A0A444XXW0_ARAHY|nr:hypothetical protein Ahy_B08g089422 [Arachis hypogaea]
MFSPEICDAIIRTPISFVNREDNLYWPAREDGIYTIKTGYFAAKGEFQSRGHGNPSTSDARRELWKEIWKMEVPSKIKSFLWKAAHDIVPVNSNLYKKRIAESPICQICTKEVETTEHALLLCEWTRAAWFGADCQCIPTTETVTEFGDWFMTIIQKIKSVGGEEENRRISKIGFLVWEIWKTRNQKVYQQQEINPSWTIKRAKLMKNLFWRIADKQINLKEKQVQRTMREVRWRPPPADWIKANVDAFFKRNTGKGAIAVVYRDNRGKILLGFTGLIQANSVTVAEALAIRQALIIANNLFMEKVLIESDNLKIIQAIKSKSPIGEALAIIQDIQLLLEQLPGRGITWTPREGNLLAHKVAKEAELGNLHSNWSMQPPLEILRIMHNETLSVTQSDSDPKEDGTGFGVNQTHKFGLKKKSENERSWRWVNDDLKAIRESFKETKDLKLQGPPKFQQDEDEEDVDGDEDAVDEDEDIADGLITVSIDFGTLSDEDISADLELFRVCFAC